MKLMHSLKKAKLTGAVMLGLCSSVAAHAATTPIIMGYYENWDTYHGYPFNSSNTALQQQLSEINAIVYAFMTVDTNGVVQFSDTWSDLNTSDATFCAQNKETCNNVNPGTVGGLGNFNNFATSSVATRLVSVGGANNAVAFGNAINNNPTNLVNSIVTVVNGFGLSGVDIDYEPAAGITNYQAFQSFISALRNALGPDKIITQAVMVNPTWINAMPPSAWQVLTKDINYFDVMGYDMHGEFDNPSVGTDLHSALYADGNDFSDAQAIQDYEGAGIPANQLILGFPAYGRAVGGVAATGLDQHFTTSVQGDLDPSGCSTTLGAGNVCGGEMSYKSIIANGYQAQESTVNNVPVGVYANFTDAVTASQMDFVSYDDVDSVTAKANYVKANGLAGMMEWVLRFDAPVTDPNSLLNAVNKVLGPIAPATPMMKLELTNESANTATNVYLYDSKGLQYNFSLSPGQDTVYCSKAEYAQPNSGCQVESGNLDSFNGTIATVAAGANQTSCGTINPLTGYNHVMFNPDTNACQIN